MSIRRSDKVEILRLLNEAEAEGRTPEVLERLRWFLHYSRYSSISRICKEFGIARSTFYRWAQRFNPEDLSSLEDNPRFVLKEETKVEQVVGVQGKEKIDNVETRKSENVFSELIKFLRKPIVIFIIGLSLIFNIFFQVMDDGYRVVSSLSNHGNLEDTSNTIDMDFSSIRLRLTDCDEGEDGLLQCFVSVSPRNE